MAAGQYAEQHEQYLLGYCYCWMMGFLRNHDAAAERSLLLMVLVRGPLSILQSVKSLITFWSSSFLFFFLRTIASYHWAAKKGGCFTAPAC
jgi:hypothetical protein